MTTANDNEAKYLLNKLITQDGPDLALSHPWLWESDRWKELAFALLTRIISLPEIQVRELTDNMNDLGLLDITALANIGQDAKTLDLNSPHARHILEEFLEVGLSPEEAQRGLATLCEAAVGLRKGFSGKVQRYLRSVGETMLRDIPQTFQFSALKDAEIKYAFTYWLQNVMNMPLSLLDTSTLEFCEQHHLTPEQLIKAADELDLNLALMDDLIQHYLSRQENVKAQP